MGNAEDALETRNRLLEAAVELYSRKGVGTTSVQEVVEYAGVTKGAFYHHFESKAHLIQAIHDRLIGDSLEELREIVDRGADPCTTLEEVIVAIFRNNVTHKASVSLFVREYPVMPEEIVDAVRKQRDDYEAIVGDAIEEGKAQGKFRSPLPSKLLAFGMIGMCAWSIHWFDPKRSLTAEAVGRQYADMVIRGLATEAA